MARRLPFINYALALVGAGVTYAMMVGDAAESRHWIHVVTLTPLFPYLVGAGLAYRHRRRPRFGAIVAGLLVFSAAIGWPMFWFFYLPHDVRPATKVLIKIILPVCQGLLLIAVGVVMELTLGVKTHRSAIERY